MKGYIYKLCSDQTNDIYIGSTKLILSTRFRNHKSDFKKKKNYMTSFELLKYDDVRIECIEIIEFNEISELKKKEGEYQRNLKCVKKKIEGTTKQEQNKNYYEKNKEKVKEIMKKWNSIGCTCECGTKVKNQGNLRKHRKTKKHLDLIYIL